MTVKATIFGEEVVLHQPTSGNYCMDIWPIFTSNNKCQKVLVLKTNFPYFTNGWDILLLKTRKNF